MSNPPTDQEVMAHICQILELDDQAATFLEANWIKSVRRLTTTTMDIYQVVSMFVSSFDDTMPSYDDIFFKG